MLHNETAGRGQGLGRVSHQRDRHVNAADTGSSDLQPPHGPILKTRPVLHLGGKEERQEKPAAGDRFRYRAPQEECQVPTVGIQCKTTVSGPSLCTDR